MSKGREIRYFDYVNHPYQQVADALTGDAPSTFQAATKSAVSRAEDVASELHINIAGIDIATDISILVVGVEKDPGGVKARPKTTVVLEWEATKLPRLFPFMRAELSIYPLTATETQLELAGNYEPPMGVLGSAINAIAGHTIAEASVHRFVNDVADYLRRSLD